MILLAGKPFGVEQLKSLNGGVGILDTAIGYSPKQFTCFAVFSNMLTLAKFGFILVNMMLLSVGLLGLVLKRREKREKKEP